MPQKPLARRTKPVGVGIVGLSSKPGAWATLAHLPRLTSSPNCKIVALCNSTLQSTQAAIAAHNLGSSVKAYQSTGELALDPDVDLVVVSTRADTHLSVAEPAIRAGKDVFVEWPLAATTADARRMVTLANEAHIRTMIGLQGRMSPTIKKIKSMVDAGELGVIHSVSYQGVVNIWQHNAADERYLHFIDRKVGGNLLTIYGGHTLDSIFFALGELKPKSYTPLAVNFRPKMHLSNPDGSLSSEVYEKDTPDQILLQGQLDREPPAVLSFHLRAGSRFLEPEAPGSTWRIYGTKGELMVTFASAGPQMAKANFMRLSDFETGQTRDITPDEGGSEWENLPKQGQNIGRLYEAYATDDEYGDFALALKRHELLDEFWATME